MVEANRIPPQPPTKAQFRTMSAAVVVLARRDALKVIKRHHESERIIFGTQEQPEYC